MKTSIKILCIGLMAFSFTTFTSCKKCYECTRDGIAGTETERVCDDAAHADERAENLEDDGFSCTLDN